MLTIACCSVVGIGLWLLVRVRFSVQLVSGYASVFVLLSAVTLPVTNDLNTDGQKHNETIKSQQSCTKNAEKVRTETCTDTQWIFVEIRWFTLDHFNRHDSKTPDVHLWTILLSTAQTHTLTICSRSCTCRESV